ncbi:MAG: DUF429 domain-containing protein [Pseudonocardia sp.]|jgi:predicted RNase H-like nuclease
MGEGALVAGVDGVKSSWVVALVTAAGDVTWELCVDAREVLAVTDGCAAVAVDVPMGLPADGYRESEVLAKQRLGAARSAIFYTPVREVLRCDTHEQASAVSREATGKKISVQTWGLVKKIRDWDRTEKPEHLVEAHPELSFRAIAPDLEFAGKKSTRGALQRMAVLDRWLAGLRGVRCAATADGPPGVLWDVLRAVPERVPLDDALDALACAWTACRVAANEAERLGDELDAVTGQLMTIVI